MECKYSKNDCITDRENCILCYNSSKYIKAKEKKYGIKKNYNKQSKRMGSTAEIINHKNNADTVSSNMTPNSGSGRKFKGDEQIRGLVNIMQEVKTQEITRAKGHSQFTIKKEWLDKLNKEAKAEDMEFWHLVFSFKDNDEQQYCIIDMKQMQDMIATIVDDRKETKASIEKINIVNKRSNYLEAENTKLYAEIEYLKSLLNTNNIKF